MKTKLGISVALFVALTYLLGLFSGYVALVVVVGYVLLCEEDEVVKKSAVKALVILICFSLASAVLGLIPNLINVVDNLCNIFGGSFHIYVVSSIVSFLNSILTLAEKVLLLVLAFMAFVGKTVKLPVLDELIDKYM